VPGERALVDASRYGFEPPPELPDDPAEPLEPLPEPEVLEFDPEPEPAAPELLPGVMIVVEFVGRDDAFHGCHITSATTAAMTTTARMPNPSALLPPSRTTTGRSTT
jgi:hypothetical protein